MKNEFNYTVRQKYLCLTLTRSDPSAIAASKSLDIPIDSSAKLRGVAEKALLKWRASGEKALVGPRGRHWAPESSSGPHQLQIGERCRLHRPAHSSASGCTPDLLASSDVLTCSKYL